MGIKLRDVVRELDSNRELLRLSKVRDRSSGSLDPDPAYHCFGGRVKAPWTVM